jgi:hypothetical protein
MGGLWSQRGNNTQSGLCNGDGCTDELYCMSLLACGSWGSVTYDQDTEVSEARDIRRCHMSFECRQRAGFVCCVWLPESAVKGKLSCYVREKAVKKERITASR